MSIICDLACFIVQVSDDHVGMVICSLNNFHVGYARAYGDSSVCVLYLATHWRLFT